MDSRIFHKFTTLKYHFEHEDEPWEYTEEPHTSRRKEILAKYPQIKKLMGYDSSITYIVLTEVFIQILMCYFVSDMSWGPMLLLTYVVSGTLNHSLGSAIHEIGHNLAYGHAHPLWNRALGMVCNLPIGVPLSVTYKKYHSDHHRYLGNKDLDADIPMKIECLLFKHPITRVIWLIFHPIIHGFRPFIKKPTPMSGLEAINWVVQAIFDAIIFYFFGFKALVYCVFGTIFGLGFHPLAGHFISEHYMFNKGNATVSYYGPLNPILFNVGYHVEHHDFPYIPWHRLPEVRKIAPEYYDTLPYHTSWLKVLWKFLTDDGLGPQGHAMGYMKSDLDEIRPANGKTSTLSSSNILKSNGHANGHIYKKHMNGTSSASHDVNYNQNGKVRQS